MCVYLCACAHLHVGMTGRKEHSDKAVGSAGNTLEDTLSRINSEILAVVWVPDPRFRPRVIEGGSPGH